MAQHALIWGEEPTPDDRSFALLAHLSTFVAPFAGPFLFLLFYGDKSRFIKYHAIQALVSHLFVWVAALFVVAGITVLSVFTCGFGAFLYPVVGILPFIHIYGAMQANNGAWSGYPLVDGIGRD